MKDNRGAAALRAWLTEHEHTQATFAERVGTHQQNVSSWLAGRQITIVNALAVKMVTGIPIEAWVEPAEPRRRVAKSA